MGATIPDPLYLVTDASGNGSVFYRGQKVNCTKDIHKITVETTATGSGTVAIYFRGTLISSKPVALLMTAEGVMRLHAGEEVEVRFTSARAGATFKITAHYEEVPL